MVPGKFIKYNPKLFSKGKRGLIYTFEKNKKIFAIKIKNPDSEAIARIQNESNFLQLLNKYKVGPKLIEADKDYIVYKFIEGKTLKEFLKIKKLNKKIVNKIIKQCKILDKLKINKEEMHNPIKNIIIAHSGIPILIDFERCHFTHRPKNLNQFNQFLKRFNLS
ncbi:hypothetical protein J4440_04950 [Candidatus Woesearchaeota archaeon]|nr:hypothetical protein [Candidatus Woesearchaeota archaeon]